MLCCLHPLARCTNYKLPSGRFKQLQSTFLKFDLTVLPLSCCLPFPREWVHVLTRQDLESETYSVEDVVLPVIGTSTIFPANSVADKSAIALASSRRRSDMRISI